MSTSDDVRTSAPTGDAPLTLDQAPAATLGLRDAFGLWASLGVSLLLPVAAVFVVLPGRPLLLLAGVLATAMALRPLGVARVLARYAVWAALAAVLSLFVEVLAEPLPPLTEGAATSFWTAADIVIALPVSWFPLVADYTRHVRSGRAAFTGAAAGYGLATVAMFTLGVVALAAYGSAGFDVIDALLALPLGALAVLVLVSVELDEAFANVYSTAVSAQNIVTRADRRVLAVVVGAVATLLALTFDIAAYEPFLFLIGAVFVPLVGVFVVAYFSTPRGAWDTSDTAPARPVFLLPWVAGFLAYQLTLPTFFAGPGAGWTAWWTARQADLGIDPANGWSASLVSLAVAVTITALVCLPPRPGCSPPSPRPATARRRCCGWAWPRCSAGPPSPRTSRRRAGRRSGCAPPARSSSASTRTTSA